MKYSALKLSRMGTFTNDAIIFGEGFGKDDGGVGLKMMSLF